MAGTRPFGVTLIGIIMIVDGILALIGSIVALFNLNDGIHLVGAILIGLIGLIYLAVARGLLGGSRGARTLVTIVTVLSLIVGAFTLLFSPELRLSGLVQAVVAVVILLLLYGKKAQAYFA